MASADVVASTRGGRQVALKFERAARDTDRELEQAVREAGQASVFVFRTKAPRKSGRLGRGIRSTARGVVAVVTAHARNPQTGFDYVGVTRFGHRVRRIVPKHDAPDGRYLAPIPGVGPRWVSKAAALLTPFGFRRSVKGYKPGRDWAKSALPAAERVVLAAGTRAGKRIVARLG